MVNVKLARHRERQAIIITVPGARSRSAGAVRHHIAAITLQDSLSGVASSADRDPVVEQIAVVGRTVTLGFDGQLRQIGPGSGNRDWCWQVSTARYGGFNGCSEGGAGSKKHRDSGVESHWKRVTVSASVGRDPMRDLLRRGSVCVVNKINYIYGRARVLSSVQVNTFLMCASCLPPKVVQHPC